MKKKAAALTFVASILVSTSAWSEDQVIHLTECGGLTAGYLHELARDALLKRAYNIEVDTETHLVGEQDDLKAEILIESESEIVIRWQEGFGHRRDTWLRNLKTDILWALAE